MPSRSLALFLLLSVAASAEPVNPRLVQRYKEMLATNPVEGTALERLWKTYSEAGKAADLLQEYKGASSFAERMVLGHLLRRAERPEEAAEAYRTAAQRDPVSPLPHLGLARLHTQAGRNADAAAAWQAGAERIPAGDPRLTEALLEAGNAWMAAGQREQATAAWERTVAAAPKDIALRERLTETYLENGLLDPAIPHLQYVVEHGPPKSRADALKQLARVHQLAGRADEAIQSLERAIALTAPGNWLREELQDQLIRYHQRLHRTRELEDRWTAYAAKNPRDITAYLQLLALYERLGELEKARDWLEKLVALTPKDFGYRWRLARLRLRLDDMQGATTLYDQLLAVQPGNSDLVFERAALDVRGEHPEAGAERVARFAAARPEDEAIRGRALQFYEHHHLSRWIERHLRAEARQSAPAPVRALADFLFTQGREEEAEQELKRLARPGSSATERAGALLETAQALKGHGHLTAALETVQEALLIPEVPAARDAHLLAADLHTALKQSEAAKGALEKAAALSRTPAEQSAVDQKLFDALRLGPAGEEVRPAPLPPPGGTQLPDALRAFLEGLVKEAKERGTEDAWLRVARWRSWTRDKGGALEAARKAVEIAPASIAAHEALIALVSSDPASPIATAYLEKLAALDPENRTKHLQRIAQLKLQSGNIHDALSILEDLARTQPGNLEVLQDLALVRERSHDWSAAVEAWQQIYRAGNSTRNREALTPLLRGLEELGRIQPAAEMLLAEVNAATDAAVRTKLFDQLLAHCTKHQLLPWLAGEWQKRRLRTEDTYANEVAYSQILKAQGDASGAFDALWEASFSAPDLAEALPTLVREAEDRYHFAAAVELQSRLLRAQAQPDAAGFLKLAQLQERLLALDHLTETWERAVTRFPRETTVLLPAAEFFLDLGKVDRASDLYRRAIEVEPTNGKALLARAGLELERGRTEVAAACLEQLLVAVKASPEEMSIRLPQVKPTEGGRLQGAYLSAVRHRRGYPRVESMRALQQFWVDRAGKQTASGEVRYEAIQQLAEIVRLSENPAHKRQWLARWQAASATAPGEALWALHHAGEGEAAISVVEDQIRKDPKNVDHQQAFLWVALQAGQWERLGKWVREPTRTANDTDFFTVALGQFLQSEAFRPLDDAALAQLFPSSGSARIWQAAALYASHARFDEATRIGRKAFAVAGVRESSFGQELANWYLSIGETEQALAVLQEVVKGAGETFDAPVYAALRQCYLLLPPEERAPFVERMDAQLAGAPPIHRALASALLHGLEGNLEKARAHLDALVKMRPMAAFVPEELSSASARSWTFLLSVGLQLQAWKLEPLAEHLWARVLADPALVALEGDGAAESARDMRLRLFALRAALASPVEFETKVAEHLRTHPVDGLLPLGEALENLGAPRQALAVYRRDWELDPSNPQALRNLLNACRSTQDVQATEAVLRACIEKRFFATNETLHRDLLSQLADVLDQQGASAEALQFLHKAALEAPHDPRLLQRLALFQERLGQTSEAEASWRQLVAMDPVNASFRLSLATLLQKTERVEEAIALLTDFRDAQGEVRLAELYLQAGHTEEALAICYRATPAQLSALMLRLIPRILEHGDLSQGRSLLQYALERIVEPTAILQIRTRLAESFDPVKERPLLERELRRIRRLASQPGAQQDTYFDWLQRQASTLKIEPQVREELQQAWEDGAGRIGAGIALCLLDLPRPAEAEAVLTQLLERRDLAIPEVDRLTGAFEAAGRLDWLARVQQRAVEMNALDDERLIAWIRTLHQAYGTDRARAALDRWSPRLWLSEESAALGGEMYAELGARQPAEALFLHAIRHDPFGRNARVRIQFARLKRLQGDLRGAQALLLQAYRNPTQNDFQELIEWLSAAGKLDAYEAELAAFALSDHQTRLFKQALARHSDAARQ